jgi:hypothetical protein
MGTDVTATMLAAVFCTVTIERLPVLLDFLPCEIGFHQ